MEKITKEGPDALVSGEPDALAAFARSVRRWHRPLSLFLAAPLRPCLWASPLLDRVLDTDVGLPRYIHAQRVDVLYDGCGSDTSAIHEIMRC